MDTGARFTMPVDLTRQIDEAANLRARLHRLVIALGIAEEVIADRFERLAVGHPASERLLLDARQARQRAARYREFAVEVEDDLPLRPKRPPD